MMRVPIQAFIAPWISALLFIFIFGFVVGGTLRTIGGHRYIEFVLPGILMMNIVNAASCNRLRRSISPAFCASSRKRWFRRMSYAEMIAGTLAVVVVRSTVTAIGILVMGLVFGATAIRILPGLPVLGGGGVDHFRPAGAS